MVRKWGELVVFSGRRLGFSLGYWELPDIKAGWLDRGKWHLTQQGKCSCPKKSWHKGVKVEFQAGVEFSRVSLCLCLGQGPTLGVGIVWDEQRSPSGDEGGTGTVLGIHVEMGIVPHLWAYHFRQNRYFAQWSMKGLDRFKSILSIAGQEGGDGFWKFLSRGNGFTAAAKGPQAGCFSCLMSDGGGGRHPWPPELGGWVCSPGPAMVQAKGQHWWGKDSTVEEQVSRRQAGRRVCFGRPCCGFLFFVSSWSNSVYMMVNSSPGWSKPELQTDRAHLLEQQSVCSKRLQAIGWASLQLCIRFSFVIDWLENHVRPGVSEWSSKGLNQGPWVYDRSSTLILKPSWALWIICKSREWTYPERDLKANQSSNHMLVFTPPIVTLNTLHNLWTPIFINLNFQKLLPKTSLVYILILCLKSHQGFPRGPVVKNLSCNAEDTSSTAGIGRSHMSQNNKAHVPKLLGSRAYKLQPLCSHA